jgi:hypothetical protein
MVLPNWRRKMVTAIIVSNDRNVELARVDYPSLDLAFATYSTMVDRTGAKVWEMASPTCLVHKRNILVKFDEEMTINFIGEV